MTNIKKTVGEDTEKSDHPCIIDENTLKWYNFLGKWFGSFLKELNIYSPYDPETSLITTYPREVNICPHKDL